ncbi:hypothetical protein ABZ330_29260 [Streptomyces sp. NPDC006172]|uniref:hypothetical protein n=1 Tax=Streptomyces sp. NPDC006172 TaxID=3154470 RepID=UPI0033CF937B
MNGTRNLDDTAGPPSTGHGPWAVLRAVAAVVLGPADRTACVLEQANKAPLHHPGRAGWLTP